MPTTTPVDPANPVDPSTPVTPVDPTKPVQSGRCKSITAPVAGTDDMCAQVTNKDGCYATVDSANANPCEWTTVPTTTPVDPSQGPLEHCVSNDRFTLSTYTLALDNCQNIKDQAGCANLAALCEWKPVDE